MTFIDQHVQNFLKQAQDMAANAPKMRDLPPTVGRQMMDAMVMMADLPAPAITHVEDQRIADVPCRLYSPRPNDATPRPVFLFIHGGGFVIGGLTSHHALAADIAHQLDMTVVAVDYRLAPEHPFPAAHDDCAAVAAALLEGRHTVGHPVSGLVVGGDSAGGNLAAATANRFKAGTRCQLLLYPVTDFFNTYASAQAFAAGYVLEQADMTWFEQQFIPPHIDRRDPRLSPLFADLVGSAPAIIITCSLDPLQDQGKAYADALQQVGVAVDYQLLAGHPHGAFSLRQAMPGAQAALSAALRKVAAYIHD